MRQPLRHNSRDMSESTNAREIRGTQKRTPTWLGIRLDQASFARGATLAEAARKLAVAVEPRKDQPLWKPSMRSSAKSRASACACRARRSPRKFGPRVRAPPPRVRLVFDTNVLVSALLTPGGTSHLAVRAAAAANATLLDDAWMLAEYRAVLSRPSSEP